MQFIREIKYMITIKIILRILPSHQREKAQSKFILWQKKPNMWNRSRPLIRNWNAWRWVRERELFAVSKPLGLTVQLALNGDNYTTPNGSIYPRQRIRPKNPLVTKKLRENWFRNQGRTCALYRMLHYLCRNFLSGDKLKNDLSCLYWYQRQ